ncbi:aryl-phospho-beta-D-glucosidase BglC (GH1 family) [Dysgonomonadaceae bacterium PH5-43]|nr:aryl-phospho-beta-D-glucosidase BglC (GH1 family) [Dysgonomonadaceae bacterium PH5-43]
MKRNSILQFLFVLGILMSGIPNIQEIKSQIPTAAIPSLSSGSVVNVYSSKYGTDTPLSFVYNGSSVDAKTEKADEKGNPLIKFTNVARKKYCEITYTGNNGKLDLRSNDKIHISIYVSTATSITIDVGGEATLDLGSKSLTEGWNELDIDISNWESSYFKKLQFQVSAPSDIYLDHIYFYGADDPSVTAAPIPTQTIDEIINVYSTTFLTGNDQFSFTNATQVYDKSRNKIWQVSDFGSQSIEYKSGLIDVTGKNTLRLTAYADVACSVNVKLTGDTGEEQTITGFDLVAEQWNEIDVDIRNFLTISNGNLSKIELIKGDAGTTNIYLDNIFFFFRPSEAPEPTLSSNDVVTFWSSKYNEEKSVYFGNVSTITARFETDADNNEIIKITQIGSQPIYFYDSNKNTELDLSDKNHLHLELYPMAEPSLKLRLFYDSSYKDYTLSGITPNEWNSVDINITDFIQEVGSSMSQITLINSLSATTIYTDHIYFYKEAFPANMPYLPPVRKSDYVKSIYSEAYNSALGTGFPVLESGASEVTIASLFINSDGNKSDKYNKVWQFKNMNNPSVRIADGGLNVSDMEYLNLDIYTAQATSINIILKPTSGENSTYAVSNLVPEEWNRVAIPLSEFANLDKIEYLQFGNISDKFFVTNVYFSKDEPLVVAKPINEANKDLGRGVNLGNVFEDKYAGASGNNWTITSVKSWIDEIANLGFDHIRLPVKWDQWGLFSKTEVRRTQIDAPYLINPTFLKEEVQEVVDHALAKGLKVVLNIHHYDDFYEKPASFHRDRFKAMWTQIGDYFKYYSHDLFFEMLNEPRDPMTEDIWNALIPETLPIMRSGANNETRPIMIATADWGGFPFLEKLKWPSGDDNLIATVHFYNPAYIAAQGGVGSAGVNTDVDWFDMQIERDMIQTFIELGNQFQEKNPGVPMYIGEFGSAKKAETDSRSLWITYMRDLFEKQGYSHAYWEFRAGYGFYNANSKVYNQPIVDALLLNTSPKKPAEHKLVATRTIFDLNTSGKTDWTNLSSYSEDNLLIKEFTGGIWGPGKSGLAYAPDKSTLCRITFKAKADKENVNFLVSTSSAKLGEETTGTDKMSEFIFSPPTAEAKEYSFIIDLIQNSKGGSISFRINSPLSEVSPVTLTISDLLIEEVEKLHEAAPLPTLTIDKVTNIYSTEYGTTSLTFGGTNAGYVKDNSSETGKDIIQITGFDSQTITPESPITIGDKTMLTLNAFAGSQMRGLTVTVNGDGGSVSKTFDLPSHGWKQLYLNVSGLTSITSIELSGGTGEGRKLYLDHIYIYKDNDTRMVWTGAESADWNTPGNWEKSIAPNANSIVYLPGNLTKYPVLSGEQANNVCKEIYFLYGSQLGRPDLLTYEKAHIQMNFGLNDTDKQQQESGDINNHLEYSAKYSSTPITRDKWHMLSMPLQKVVTGDLSFGGYPGVYVRKFEATQPTSGSVLTGNWTNYYNTMVEEFQPGEGFIFWMDDRFADQWPYYEYGKGTDPVFSTEREYGLQQINGIVELPYYEDKNMSTAHRVHQYDSKKKNSSFYPFNSSGALTGSNEDFSRGENNEAYRFVFEKDNSSSPNVTYPIAKPTDSNLALIGNPYMSSIDFDEFYEDNKASIKHLYKLWTGNSFSGYNTLGSDGSVEIDKYIAPMQSFLVELNDGVNEANLTFNVANISTTASANTLRSTTPISNNKLKIIASNASGSVSTFIAKRENGKDTFSDLEGHKIMTSVRKIPEIYLIKPSATNSSEMVGVSSCVIGREPAEIPLALATTLQGETVFSFTGMNSYNAKIIFVDKVKGVREDITGKEAFEYSFDYTPLVGDDNKVISCEERFTIIFLPLEMSITDPMPEESIKIYSNEAVVNVMSLFGNSISEIAIYDMLGQLLFKSPQIDTEFYQIPMDKYKYDFVVVRVASESSVTIKKINIQ